MWLAGAVHSPYRSTVSKTSALSTPMVCAVLRKLVIFSISLKANLELWIFLTELE